MYDRTVNATSQRFITEYVHVGSEYVCQRTTKFHSEILFDSRVINLQISTTKYHDFQYSDTNCSHLSGSDIVLKQ